MLVRRYAVTPQSRKNSGNEIHAMQNAAGWQLVPYIEHRASCIMHGMGLFRFSGQWQGFRRSGFKLQASGFRHRRMGGSVVRCES